MKKVEDYVRSIPDFPEPGIIFRDVTSILQDADGLQLAIDAVSYTHLDVYKRQIPGSAHDNENGNKLKSDKSR